MKKHSTTSMAGSNAACSSIAIKRDRLGRAHFRPTLKAPERAARFRIIQKALLDGTLKFRTIEARIVCLLIAFDAILTRPDLVLALRKLESVYWWRDAICLEWTDADGRNDRRFLSVFTKNALALERSGVLDDSSAILDAETSLRDFFGDGDLILDEFLLDGQAWAFEIMPGPFLAHVIGAIKLSGLSRACLAREQSRLALAKVSPTTSETSGNLGLEQAFQGYWSPKGKDDSSWLIDRIAAACHCRRAVRDTVDKKRMLHDCMGLAQYAADAGPVSSLISGFVIDFIESGTPTQTVISRSTVELYTRAALHKLFAAFQKREIESLSALEFNSIYLEIRNAAKAGNQKTTAAALTAWHAFLVRCLDVPVLNSSLYQGLPEIVPRANVVWPHEQETVWTWIEAAQCDERLRDQLLVAFAIASKLRIRISELLALRLRNITKTADEVAIEICPLRRDNRLKTEAGRRIQTVEETRARSVIDAWVTRRVQEGAYPNDFLFGDPYSPAHGYRLGATYFALNAMLKAVTGDDAISFHILSHSFLTDELGKAAVALPLSDVNPYDATSAAAGHASSQTSFYYYFHAFETPIRLALNQAIQDTCLTDPVVVLNSKISAHALRKRRSRAGNLNDADAKGSVAWHAIAESSTKPNAPAVSDGINLAMAISPPFLTAETAIGIADVIHALTDLSSGKAGQEISLRCGRPLKWVRNVADCARDVLVRMREIRWDPTCPAPSNSIDVVTALGKCAEHRSTQFNRLGQEKLQPVLDFLLRASTSTIAATGASSWLACYHAKGYLVLDEPKRAAGLISLFHDAAVPVSRLLVCGPETPCDCKAGNMYDHIAAVFGASYGSPPLHKAIAPRRGRPDYYLLFGSQDLGIGEDPGGAAVSNAGFNALLFALNVFLRMEIRSREGTA
jgi:integrase